MISPAKYGRLGVFHFREVATRLPEVCFRALPPTSITFRTLEVIEMFPDALYGMVYRNANSCNSGDISAFFTMSRIRLHRANLGRTSPRKLTAL